MPDLDPLTNRWTHPSEKEIASVYCKFNEVFSGDDEQIKATWRGPSGFYHLGQITGDYAVITRRHEYNPPTAAVERGVTITGSSFVYGTLTKRDLIENEDHETKDFILRIKSNLALSCRDQLANRLDELFGDAKEEESSSVGISVDSLRSFYSLLTSYPNLKCPEIALTPDNDIYISWKREPDKLFSVHFSPNGDSRFVLFFPNDMHPGRPIRISGLTTADKLIETVSSQGVLDWIR